PNDSAANSSSVEAKLRRLQQLSHDLTALQARREPVVLSTPLLFADSRLQLSVAQNLPYLEYEDALLKKLIELDAIDSEGSEVVRMQRKELVQRCQEQLAVLDRYRAFEIERQARMVSRVGENDSAENSNLHVSMLKADGESASGA